MADDTSSPHNPTHDAIQNLLRQSSYGKDDVDVVLNQISFSVGLSPQEFFSKNYLPDYEASLTIAVKMCEGNDLLDHLRPELLRHAQKLLTLSLNKDNMTCFKLLIQLFIKTGEESFSIFNSSEFLSAFCNTLSSYQDLDREALKLMLELTKFILMDAFCKSVLLKTCPSLAKNLLAILNSEKPYKSPFTNMNILKNLMEAMAALSAHYTEKDDLGKSSVLSLSAEVTLLLRAIIHDSVVSELQDILLPALKFIHNLSLLNPVVVYNDTLVQVLIRLLSTVDESIPRYSFILAINILNRLLTQRSALINRIVKTIHKEHFKRFSSLLTEGNDQIIILQLLKVLCERSNNFCRKLLKYLNVSKVFSAILRTKSDNAVVENLLEVVDAVIASSNEFHDRIFTETLLDSLMEITTKDTIKSGTKVFIFRILEVLASVDVSKMSCLLSEGHRELIWNISKGSTGTASQTMQVKALEFIKKYIVATDGHVCKFKSRLTHFIFKILTVILLFRNIINNSAWIVDLYNLDLLKSSTGATVWTILVSIYINILSLQAFNTRLMSGHTSAIMSVHGVRQTFLRKYFCPWPWDRPIGVLFNILTLAQLHRVINMIEIFCHPPLTLQELADMSYNKQRLALQASLLQNIPLLILRIILVSEGLLPGSLKTTFATALLSILMISYDLYSFEGSCYAACYIGSYGLNTFYQYVIVLGYVFMLLGRIIMFFLLYLWLNGNVLIILCTIAVHYVMTLVVNMFVKHSMYKSWKSESQQFMKHRFVTLKYLKYSGSKRRATIFKSFTNFISLLMYNGIEILLVTLRHPVDFLHNRPHHWHRRNLRYFVTFYLLHLVEIVLIFVMALLGHIDKTLSQIFNIDASKLSGVSVALFILSGICLLLYIWILNPLRRGVYDESRNDYRTKPPSTLDGRLNFCDVRPQYRKKTYENQQKQVI